MSGPWEKFAANEQESGPWSKFVTTQPKPAPEKAEPGFIDSVKQGAKNLAKGVASGFADIGDTILNTVGKLAEGNLPAQELEQFRLSNAPLPIYDNAARSAGLKQFNDEHKDSPAFQVGRIGGNIAATYPVGGALASAARTALPASATSAPIANRLLQAVESAGFRTGAPAATTIKGQAGNLLTRAVGGGVTGAATAGLVNPEDAGLGALVGGGLPVAMSGAGRLTHAAGRAVRGEPVAPEVRALADRAKEIGINIPADRLVNSKPMNALAASLNYVPLSGRAATEEAMSSQLNRALSRTFGQDSSNVTMALRKAEDVLGGQFDDFLRKNTVRVDKTFIDDLAEAANRASRELGTDGASIISKQVDEILSKAAGGDIDGQAAYNIKRTLDRIGRRNSPEAWYALDLKQKLMSALDRSVGANKASEFSGLRQQYGNMLELQKLATNGVDGEVSVARLANMKNIRNPQMQELADIAAQFVKAREGQHGAMQRTVAGMAAGSIGGLPVLAGGAAAGRGLNMLLNSDLARNAVVGAANPAVENALNKLLPLTYRTAPVLSGQ